MNMWLLRSLLCESCCASDLLDDDIDLITILHVEFLGGLSVVEALAVEEEAHVGDIELGNPLITLCRWQ